MESNTKIIEKHYKFTKIVNTMLLVTHASLLGLFSYLHITLMVYVNIISIAFYLFQYLVYKKSIVRYVFVVYLEVLVHMVLATISVGWDAGFQFYGFCLIPCIFLCDYLSRTDGGKPMHPIKISIIVIVLFLGARLFCQRNTAIYVSQTPDQYTLLFAYNTVVAFVFLIIYMYVFGDRILIKEQQLEKMAERDELTRLPNRYLMHEWLTQGFLESTGENKFAVAIMDIDDFKRLNDTHGHEFGDAVLKEIASDINHSCDENLKVSRWGGEEFVFMETGVDAYREMCVSLERLRKAIEERSMAFKGNGVLVTVTIGVAEYRPEDSSYQDTLNRADERLYKGKELGKNRLIGEEEC